MRVKTDGRQGVGVTRAWLAPWHRHAVSIAGTRASTPLLAGRATHHLEWARKVTGAVCNAHARSEAGWRRTKRDARRVLTSRPSGDALATCVIVPESARIPNAT